MRLLEMLVNVTALAFGLVCCQDSNSHCPAVWEGVYGICHAENEDAEAEIFIQPRHRQPAQT